MASRLGKLGNKEKVKSLLRVTTGAAMLFGGISLYRGNEDVYEKLVMPLARLMDPEAAHGVAVTMAKWKLLSPVQKVKDPSSLAANVLNLQFPNPVGMAAGFDKQGEAVQGLCRMGFGFVEIGSVTPRPQPGNPKPRVFRLAEDRAVINRYGFNSDGHEEVHGRLVALKSSGDFEGIVGVNLGKNKLSEEFERALSDYVEGLKMFSDVADYFVINVSSPNTPGLRKMQDKEQLDGLLTRLNEERKGFERKPPLLLKLAPDLSEEERKDIAEVIQKPGSKVDGLVLSNTTISRENLKSWKKDESGGLSGAPLTDLSTTMIEDMYRRTGGSIPIIGVGGVFSGQEAYEKIKAGASLVQIYTSYIYHGPPIVQKIKRELKDLLEKDGYHSVLDAVGKNHRHEKVK